jgi:hypothetical protein
MASQTFNNIEGLILIGTTTASAVPEVREWTIDTSTNSSPDPEQGDVWETSTLGLSTFGMNITTNYDIAVGGGKLQKWVIGRDKVRVYAYPNRNVMTVYWALEGTLGGGGKGGGEQDTATQTFTLIPAGQPIYEHPDS